MVNTSHSQCRALHSIPCQGTRSHMLQLRVHTPQQRLKVPSAATKAWHSQINKYKLNLKNRKRGKGGIDRTDERELKERKEEGKGKVGDDERGKAEARGGKAERKRVK